MTERGIETSFREQYAELDDDVLREIARGEVPWSDGGTFVYLARRAARDVLVERGADDVPVIPAWDPASTRAPLRYRLGAVLIGALTIIIGGVAWATAFPPDDPSDAEVCDEATRLLLDSDFAHLHRMEAHGCAVDRSAAVGPRPNGLSTVPVTFSACIELDAGSLDRLRRRGSPAEVRRVQRFARAPVPGRHCLDGATPLAQLQVRPGRPWTVRLLERIP